MNLTIPQIQFDVAFVEEAVFLDAKTRGENTPLVKAFHRERENIYGQDLSVEDRDKCFESLFKKYFVEMGLDEIFEKIIVEFPLLSRRQVFIFIKKVWSKREEGAELYIQGDLMTVYMGIQINHILERTFLGSFLRHEFMHISDMLDENFQYSPKPDLGGKSAIEDNFIKNRFRVLWNLYVDARLRQRGQTPFVPEEKQKNNFKAAFSFLTEPERTEIFQSITEGGCFTQADLLNFARDQRLTKTLGEGGLRCPLCHFTSYEPKKKWTEETTVVAERIKKDHPRWEMSMGVCPQCFDMYHSNE